MFRINKYQPAFTIVELLVVIVIIGILAAITIVSYTGISSKATASALQSDLTSATNKLNMYQVEYGNYPTSLSVVNGNYCPIYPEDAKYCIKPSSGNVFDYSSLGPLYSTFSLTATNTNNTISYNATNDSGPAIIPTVTIGAQVWMLYNINVGMVKSIAITQTDDGVIEKYCYNDDLNNCTNYGGLYQWGEAMQYFVSAGAQGICPAGFHMPTEAEFQSLEVYLGMTSLQANSNGDRGTDQGTKLKTNGSSGWNGKLGGSSAWVGSAGYYWLGSQNDSTTAWRRIFTSSTATVNRYPDTKTNRFSVRCLKTNVIIIL